MGDAKWKTVGRLAGVVLLLLLVAAHAAAASPRRPAVAGSFYPSDPGLLRAAVSAFLADAVAPAPERPLALIVPHAGIIYSGQIAADACKQAAGHTWDVIVILGLNHKTRGFDGVSIYDGPGYITPLGVARCDETLARSIRDRDRRYVYRRDVDAAEHSVEVQIPFLQTLFPDVPIVAIVIGGHDQDLWIDLGNDLAEALRDRRALIVASSDLSHYPAHDVAVSADRAVLAAIAGLDPENVIATIDREENRGRPGLDTCACGEGPIVAALTAANLLGATRATVLSYANSGDAAVGDRSRCVGYGAVAVTAGTRATDTRALDPPPVADADAPLTEADRATLLVFARRTIEQYMSSATTPLARGMSPVLNRRQGAFVTLKKKGRLRGCIGHMAEDTPLGQVVGMMALQAAFNDSRFPALTRPEVEQITIEISVLTPFAPVRGPEDIVIGRDGVVLRKKSRSAVFLPQVAVEQGWDRSELLDHLSRKAGLRAGAWRQGAELLTFRAIVFGEHEKP